MIVAGSEVERLIAAVMADRKIERAEAAKYLNEHHPEAMEEAFTRDEARHREKLFAMARSH